MNIIGISCFYHDSAACLIKDGIIVAAAQEERFTRIKHDSNFPTNSIKYCLLSGNIKPKNVDYIVFYEKPFIKFERLLETYLAFAPRGFKSFSMSMPLWIKDKLFQKSNIIKLLRDNISKNINWSKILLFSEHHLSHASSAFFPSPFDKAAILTLDGVGEWTTTSVSVGNENKIKILKEIHFPHSLGLLYSAITFYTGFKVNSGEYKVMGLAPYGKPIYLDLIKRNLIKIFDDGSYQLNMKYFDYCTGLTMTNNKFNELFGGPPRNPETKITQKEMDLAASVQKIIEEIVVKIAKNVAKETNMKNLCLSGGVALNCVSNGILLKEKIFDNIWIQPASGDAGGALGAALGAWHIHFQKKRYVTSKKDAMLGSYLGPAFNNKQIEKSLNVKRAVFYKFNRKDIIKKTALALSEGKAVGWMQGRMEFGPRALGSRSIIADPRSSFMQKQLNLKVKYRESFRPFAPSILLQDLNKWFELDVESPYMLLVSDIKKNHQIQITKNEEKLFGIDKLNIPKSTIPAVTHVDYSARIQTVREDTNPRYFALINEFKKLTGCPILVNTSFNIRGEPIVCSPEDAFRCFMGTELDYLVIEDYFLDKNQQIKKSNNNYKDSYELD